MINSDCLLRKDPEQSEECRHGGACPYCGWNKENHTARIEAIRDGKLVKNEAGLKTLLVEANPFNVAQE